MGHTANAIAEQAKVWMACCASGIPLETWRRFWDGSDHLVVLQQDELCESKSAGCEVGLLQKVVGKGISREVEELQLWDSVWLECDFRKGVLGQGEPSQEGAFGRLAETARAKQSILRKVQVR
jgi:hypothetical protein